MKFCFASLSSSSLALLKIPMCFLEKLEASGDPDKLSEVSTVLLKKGTPHLTKVSTQSINNVLCVDV